MKPGETFTIFGDWASFISSVDDEETGITTMTYVKMSKEEQPKPEDYNWMLKAHRKRKLNILENVGWGERSTNLPVYEDEKQQ